MSIVLNIKMMRGTKAENLLDLITICIPVRVDSKARGLNLQCSLDLFVRNGVKRIIVCESDREAKINQKTLPPCVHYIFLEDGQDRFHRTRIINMMLGLCVTPYAAIWDADVIVPFSNFVKALTILSEDKATIVLPYDGRVWDMTEYFSQIYRIHKDERLFGYYNCQCNFMNGYESVGGGFLVDISLYRQAGLENEHFIGWGPEDEERVSRLFILGHKVEFVDGEMYHLHHWRGINSGSKDAEMALVTKREYAKICSMSKSELEAYIHTWDWIKETE